MTDNVLQLSPFSEVVEDFAAGKMVILIDDAERENEGDLVIATEMLTAEAVEFMMTYARGLICVTISDEVAQRLNLPLQSLTNNSAFQTPFAVSIDHKDVVPNGAEGPARVMTMRKMLDPFSRASDFVCPGHVFPLIANPAGVLGRDGQTEGSFDLARIAGFQASGVICEILNPDGTMARGRQLQRFSEQHGLKIASVAQIARYRTRHEVVVRELGQARLTTDYGEFSSYVFQDDAENKEHLALVYGQLDDFDTAESALLVRIHSECLTGDVFGSRRCDCRDQLDMALREITKRGSGVLLYLRQEGRGIGLSNKVRAYELQDRGADTVEANLQLGFAADQRDFAVAARILKTLGCDHVQLMTNNADKIKALESHGVTVAKRVPIWTEPNADSQAYLDTKRCKLGHLH